MKLTVDDFEKGRAWMRKQAQAFADRLTPLYEAGRHVWGREKDEKHIPNRDEILTLILILVDSLRIPGEDDSSFIRSGGIEVGVVRDGKTSFEALMRYTISENLFESCSNPEEDCI